MIAQEATKRAIQIWHKFRRGQRTGPVLLAKRSARVRLALVPRGIGALGGAGGRVGDSARRAAPSFGRLQHLQRGARRGRRAPLIQAQVAPLRHFALQAPRLHSRA